MRYINRTLAVMSLLLLCSIPGWSQSATFENHPSYGPGPKSSPQSVSRTLSYENFRNIKLLHSAIMNYGGGEGEIDALIDQYAEASAFYFQNKYTEAARLFEKNQAAILEAAKKLARKYNEDANGMLQQCVKMQIKDALKARIKGKRANETAEKFLGQGQAGVSRANDNFVRFKDATTSSARELITAIYYYRIAKDNFFDMIRVLDMSDKDKEDLLAKYKRDMDDNKNKIFVAKEKQN